MEKISKKSNYFPLVDFGRFLAAISVLCFHYFSSTAKGMESGAVKLFLENGFMGVQFFFMISGFVIFFSLQGSLAKYSLGRFLRIYPLFWFCCTLTYLITVFFGEDHLSFLTYLYNLLIVNDGKTAFMVDGSYWTLTHELFFYTYIGIFVWIFGKKNIEYFFYGWLGLLSLAVFYNLQGLLFFKILLVRSAYYFIFGGLLALLFSTWKTSHVSKKIMQLSALTLTLYMPFLLSQTLHQGVGVITNNFGMYSSLQMKLLYLIFMVMVASVYFSQFFQGKISTQISKTLGSITYPLYLLHQKIGVVFLGLFGVYGYVNYTSLLFLVFIVLVSFCIAYFEQKWRGKAYEKIVLYLKL